MQHKLKRPTQIKFTLLLLLALMAMPLTALGQPTVTLQTTDGDAAEAGQDPGSFTVERTSDVNFDQQLHVLVARTGSATQNGDYTITPFSLNTHPNIYQVTIPASQARTVVTLTPVRDNLIEGCGERSFYAGG
jgi:hypothetical protein